MATIKTPFLFENFSFWWNHTRSPENFKGGSVRGCNPPEGSPEGVPFSEASSRAKRGRPAERSEAPPSEARRLHRGSAERSREAARRSSGGRHYKKTQKGSTRKPRGTTYFRGIFRFPRYDFPVLRGGFLNQICNKKWEKFLGGFGFPDFGFPDFPDFRFRDSRRAGLLCKNSVTNSVNYNRFIDEPDNENILTWKKISTMMTCAPIAHIRHQVLNFSIGLVQRRNRLIIYIH